MKSPIDIIKGRIIDYDPRTSEVTIKARYPDWMMLTKREYRDCNIQLIDGRPLSDKQRRTCYALLKDISKFTGMGLDPTKEYLKIKFLTEDLQETADQMFSLSNAPMSLVCAFQRFLVHFMLDWDIPCSIPLLEFVDDVQDYLYACLVAKKCCVCGRHTDLHHLDLSGQAGIGRDHSRRNGGAAPLPVSTTRRFTRSGSSPSTTSTISTAASSLTRKMCKLYGLKAKEEDNAQ